MDVSEKLASAQHDIWSHWMTYMFSCGHMNDNGTWTMPKEKVERWQRQMNTAYADLSKSEKDSDRHIVRQYLDPILKLD